MVHKVDVANTEIGSRTISELEKALVRRKNVLDSLPVEWASGLLEEAPPFIPSRLPY